MAVLYEFDCGSQYFYIKRKSPAVVCDHGTTSNCFNLSSLSDDSSSGAAENDLLR